MQLLTQPPSLKQLEQDWLTQFPGGAILFAILRTALILADYHARHIQHAFLQLHLDLRRTGLPMHLWHPLTQKTYNLLQKRNTAAQKEFHKALKLLQSTIAQESKSKPKLPDPEPKPEPKPFVAPDNFCIPRQVIRVNFDPSGNRLPLVFTPPNEEYLAQNENWWRTTAEFRRQIVFQNAQCPPELENFISDQGEDFFPADIVTIGYTKEEFKRLITEEIETKCPLLLDGKRIYFEMYYKGDPNPPALGVTLDITHKNPNAPPRQ